MATARFETAAQIVKDAAVPLGLPEVADPFSSTDVAMVRLCRCLTIAGRELVQAYTWPHLRKVCDITAATGDGRAYTLPADFAGLVPGTFWNQTTNEEITGPIDAARWNDYEATGITPISPCYRVVQGTIAIIPTASVTDADALQYEYHAKSWVGAAVGTLTDDRATAAADVCHFDSLLLGVALRRAWMISNSMDTTAIESAYWQAIERVTGAETVEAPRSIVPLGVGPQLPRIPGGVWTI
jgi:hypothetical protein